MVAKWFFAYASRPMAQAEVIGDAIRRISEESRGTAEVVDWQSLRIGGKTIIKEITKAIDGSVGLACDLTYLNPNVLFEMGYAIGRGKQIWVCLDTNIRDAQDTYKRQALLRSIG
ncbi:MAG: hypothetical protein V1772_13835, partial [Chloroflexota bacterium]